jgi:cytochrome bd-type quinol oxidase subunit 2
VLEGEFILLLQSVASAFIAIFSIITFSISNNYFPDKIIEGRRKKNFNRIFLINFLLISFLFGLVFRDYKDYRNAVKLSHVFAVTGNYLPLVSYLSSFIFSCALLLFHFSILYGHYWMRRYINNNANRKQFDFETQDENGR